MTATKRQVRNLNQHAPKYQHRATRRNRSRGDQRRRAIDESK